MPRRTETREGCRWTRIDPPVNVVPSEPTVHQLLFREKRTVVRVLSRFERGVRFLTWETLKTWGPEDISILISMYVLKFQAKSIIRLSTPPLGTSKPRCERTGTYKCWWSA